MPRTALDAASAVSSSGVWVQEGVWSQRAYGGVVTVNYNYYLCSKFQNILKVLRNICQLALWKKKVSM